MSVNETPDRTTRRALKWALSFVLLLVLALLELVRGDAVQPSRRSVNELAGDLYRDAPYIRSQSDLNLVGSLAHGIVSARGGSPAVFYTKFLPRLDRLEKIHHLVHSPFNKIQNLYCDIWIHSITTYGLQEKTWSLHPLEVRPALKLPILLFLVDRLQSGSSGLTARVSSPIEAVSGMNIHTLTGRAQIWNAILGVQAESPQLDFFVKKQLTCYSWNAVDAAEIHFWRHVAQDPTREGILDWARGVHPDIVETRHPAHGLTHIDEVVASYRDFRPHSG